MIRTGLIGLLAVVAAACLGEMRLKRPVPATLGDVTAIHAIEIIDEADRVLLSGTFEEAPEGRGQVVRQATLTGQGQTTASGVATVEIGKADKGTREVIRFTLENLPYPELFRVRADGRVVAVFSTTTRGHADLYFSRITSS